MIAEAEQVGLTREQKETRRTGFGGSEIAAVVGLDPYRNAFDIYRVKVEGFEQDFTEHMERGTFLEDGVAKWWAYRNKATLRQTGTIRHPDEPLVVCTPDRLAKPGVGEELDLSIKVPGPRAYEQWGPDGSDGVPQHYFIQVQWELIPLGILYGIRKAVITAPIEGELRSYPVDAEPTIQGFLVEAAKKFQRDHISKRIPPPIDGSKSCAEWVKTKFPTNDGPVMLATEEMSQWARRLQAAKAAIEAAEEEKTQAENHLKSFCGSAAGIHGKDWKMSWKSVRNPSRTDWPAVAAELGATKEQVAKHTKSGAPYRRFTFRANGGADVGSNSEG